MATKDHDWQQAASVILPPTLAASSAPGATSPSMPSPSGFAQGEPRRRSRAGLAVVLLLTAVASGAVGSIAAFAALHNDTPSAAQPPSASPPAPPPATPPQFSAADASAAKRNLCHVFDISVGQKEQGGFRVEGNLNMPVTLRAVTSAVAVQNALTPAVPTDVASAARKYITTTFDVATAAMGNTSVNEINRLTAVSNDAVDALVDVCGLPH